MELESKLKTLRGHKFGRADRNAISSIGDLEKSLEDAEYLERFARERGETARARKIHRLKERTKAKLDDLYMRRQADEEVNAVVSQALKGPYRPIAATGPGGVKWVGRKFGDYGRANISAPEQLAAAQLEGEAKKEALQKLELLRAKFQAMPHQQGVAMLPQGPESLHNLAEANRLAINTGSAPIGPAHSGPYFPAQVGKETSQDAIRRIALRNRANKGKKMTRGEANRLRKQGKALAGMMRSNPMLAMTMMGGGQGGDMSPAMAVAMFGNSAPAILQAMSNERQMGIKNKMDSREAELRRMAIQAQIKASRAKTGESSSEEQAKQMELRSKWMDDMESSNAGDAEQFAAEMRVRGVPDEVIADYIKSQPHRFEGWIDWIKRKIPALDVPAQPRSIAPISNPPSTMTPLASPLLDPTRGPA